MGFSAEALLDVFRSLPIGAVGVEVGVCRGENAFWMLEKCPNISKLFCVDPWREYDTAREGKPPSVVTQETCDKWHELAEGILKPHILAGRATIIRGRSLDAVKLFGDWSLGFAFIDGDHSFAAVKADLAAWWPKVKPGGIFSGHDFRVKDKEVRRAVYEFAEMMGVTVSEREVSPATGPTCWLINKPQEGRP